LKELSTIVAHVDFAIGMVANVTAQDKEPFVLGLLQPTGDMPSRDESLIKHD
jgi:hypothetical protein